MVSQSKLSFANRCLDIWAYGGATRDVRHPFRDLLSERSVGGLLLQLMDLFFKCECALLVLEGLEGWKADHAYREKEEHHEASIRSAQPDLTNDQWND